jgi:hypothetical protein
MKIIKILWPGNSSDLNAIEKAWFWIEKETIKRGPTSNRKKLRVRWGEMLGRPSPEQDLRVDCSNS